MKRFKRILFVVEPRQPVEPVLERAVSLAQSNQAALTVVSVAPRVTAGIGMPDGGPISAELQEEVITYVEQVRQQHDQGLDDLLGDVVKSRDEDARQYLSPKRHLVKGQAQKEIPRLAQSREADLFVMGTVARTGVAGLFIGNTAEAILEQIECSVLAVKPEGFETPVSLEDRHD